ncbi:MAG: Asp-tRNA(Asn)/Glu-tRNA(Gln) amidotransferase subunit GatA [Candidatus Rokubacteria bacterium]|nr:Asp-tRNA(Asn)/Glu-tRNA(Gln) amidotransferase subunit GatA [Candidatus Rokubacteria bacterium]
MSEVAWKPIVELTRLIAAKEISPVELVQAYLDRIEALDGKLRAFITVCHDEALAAAKAAEAAVIDGQSLGPLHGVPIGLKDLYATKGTRTTGGSKILSDWIPDEDATVVARLKGAGAIVLGKLNMHEFAYGPEGLNVHFGNSWNPWDAHTHRIAGGSSSGSAVAVAAGLCAGALGSDPGGSIRIPSALCGLTGLKPTYGRASRAGVLALAWSMDHVGPMTRTAADAALLLGPMAGYDPRDPTTSMLPVPDYQAALRGEIRGLRVGLLRAFFLDSAGVVLRQAVEQAAKRLEELGARVEEVAMQTVTHAAGAAFAIVAAEALAYHEEWMKTRADDYGPDVRDRLRLGAFVSATQYLKAQRARQLIRNEVDRLLAHQDVLIAPTTPIVATPVGQTEALVEGDRQDVRSSLIRLTRPFNLSGHPVCALPCGFTVAGLPIGMQIVGRPFDEATVLRVAEAYQRATDWHTRRPPFGQEAAPPPPAPAT